MATTLVLHLQEMLSTLMLLLSQLEEKVVHALQNHIALVKTEALTEVGVGGLQIQVDLVVDGGLHLGGIIVKNGSSWLLGNKELGSQKLC